jgi:hypothetical protein
MSSNVLPLADRPASGAGWYGDFGAGPDAGVNQDGW